MDVLRASEPFTIGEVTLIVIERAKIESAKGKLGYWLDGFKHVHAIIICDAHGKRAFDLAGTTIALDGLMQKIPGLGSLLAGISKT